jgi:putative FmdB family regulatory protein
MPTYDYACSACGHSFDRILKIVDMHQPTTEPCPECHAPGLVAKIMGAPVMGDAVRLGITRTDNGFKEVLQRIHAANGVGSNLNSKW